MNKCKKEFLVYPLALLIIIVTCIPSLRAQTASSGALSGTVTDPSGAVVAGAKVSVTNLATSRSQTATSGENGAYRFSLLPPGKYKVKVDMAGFKSAEFSSITINVTETAVLNCTLEIGELTETFIVQAETEALQTETSALGTLVDSDTITTLPLTSRNYTQILDLSTGVTASVNDATSMGKGTQYTSVNGATPAQNNYQMDGVSVVNIGINGSGADQSTGAGIGIPNPDAIQEFKVQTSNFDASYGRNPGGNVNVVTKSGGNQIHGSAFEFLRNTSLNANPFFYNRDNPNSATEKPVLNQNQFGFVLGGPVVKDRFFLFGSYQGTRQKNGLSGSGQASLNLPPIPAMDRSSPDFPAALAAANCSNMTFGPKLACDGSNVNPVALKILQLKNADGSYYVPGSGTTGYKRVSYSDPARYTGDQFIINSDFIVNAKHTLSTRYFYTRDPQTITLGGTLPGNPKERFYSNHNAVLKLNTFVSNTFTNEARISFQRHRGEANETPVAGSTPQELGVTPAVPDMDRMPQLAISGGPSMFTSFNPAISISSHFQVGDQIAWSHNKHTVRAGFELENVQYFANPGFMRGYLVIMSFNDFLVGQAGNLFMCIACSKGRGEMGAVIHGYRLKNLSGYVQDDWKVNSRFTLNLGVRWEYFGAFSDKYGNLTNTWPDLIATVPVPPTEPTTSGPGLAGMVVPANNSPANQPVPDGVLQAGNNNSLESHAPYSNFGPRVGFALRLNSKGNLVLRGGFGLFYDRIWAGSFIQSVQEGSPYAVRGDYSGFGNAQTLQNPFRDVSVGVWQSRWSNLTCDPDGTNCTGTGSNISAQFLAKKIATPLMRQYNITLGYEFARNWVLEVGYVGSSGINLINEYHNLNTALLATPENPINGQTANTRANIGLRVPFIGYQAEGLKGTEFNGSSNYNSLQATLRKRFSYGLALQGSYTWSRSLTNTVGSGSYYSQNSNDPADPDQQYGPSDFDRTQRFIFNYQYDLPFGKHQGALGKLLEGWSVAGITTAQTGRPITITDRNAGTIFGSTGARAQLADGATHEDILTSGSIQDRLGGNSGGPGYLNMDAFTSAPTGGIYGDGTGWGNSGVGIVRGPGQFNWDITLIKITEIREGHSLQFRTEFYNAFNHTQFGNPASAVSTSSTFGQIASTSVNPRIIQFGLKYSF
jgi:hypothetical protein